MADNRSEYEVTIGGVPHTMLLSDEDAARYGQAAQKKAAPKPANKAATAPTNK